MAELVNAVGIRVFVYGSLKQGLHNNGLLKDAEFLGRCTIQGAFKMLDLRSFPGLVRSPSPNGETSVVGEVYRLPNKDALDTLDIIEGHPHFYSRSKVQTPWKGAWCYFLPTEYMAQAPEVEPSNNTYVWRPNENELSWMEEQRAAK